MGDSQGEIFGGEHWSQEDSDETPKVRKPLLDPSDPEDLDTMIQLANAAFVRQGPQVPNVESDQPEEGERRGRW